MLHVLITGAYYPPVVTTWRIFTRGASYLITGTSCSVPFLLDIVNQFFDEFFSFDLIYTGFPPSALQ